MKLRAFIAELLECLMLSGKTKKGRPSNLPSPHLKKRMVAPKEPTVEVRKDGVGHFPMATSQRLRCKNCVAAENKFSSVVCSKCGVTLCLNKERNCFFEYHRL